MTKFILQPNLRLAQIVGSYHAHHAFGDECLAEWIAGLPSQDRALARGYKARGVTVFEDVVAIKTAQRGGSLVDAAQAFRQAD
jgi:hypothetical protein